MTRKRSDWLHDAPVTATNPKADTPIFPFFVKLLRGEDLSANEAADLFRALSTPGTGSNQIAGVLTTLTAKGETGEELAGMASVMRSLAVRVPGNRKSFDISGTGSSTARTFNVSTAAAFVAAGAGLVVAKQSNRGISSKAGSVDVLAELGVKPAGETDVAQSALSGVGLSFLFSPKFHPSLHRLSTVRSSLGIRTCLNILSLMANPATPARQIIGVWHRSMLEPTGHALSMLKTEKAWVVHGSDGLDELTITGQTLIAAVDGTVVKPLVVSPSDFGLKPGSTDHLRVTSVKESANIIRDVLASKRRDEARSLVVMNAGAALFVGGIAKDPSHGARLAEQSIDSGMAQNKLDRSIQISNKRN